MYFEICLKESVVLTTKKRISLRTLQPTHFRVKQLFSLRENEIKTAFSRTVRAEPRRPEMPPSEARYPCRKEKETHKLILMVIMASGIARGRARTTTATLRNIVDRDMQPWSPGLQRTSLILDFHVKVN